ncbi:MAG TPA: tRNA (adenine-N1)-methyltransferase [Actinomycetota bacterium]|jgi:tRNA (adenine57-N1/adenine58-N1)-methyltransferase|nr:tRNA (adenine-N1)-methyltransferase [Actinomycetota bacterium]
MFQPGERVLLVDARGRRYMVNRLRPGESWHSHAGAVPHDLILGSQEGVRVHSTGGMGFDCFRPRLVDFVLKMPRGAQVVYPKDLGAILIEGDVFPGTRVLEAGTGSGSLTIALARAVGDGGAVVSYELREEFHLKAARNVEAFFGSQPPWLDLRLGDLRDISSSERFDRVVLDLPEPWGVLEAVLAVLDRGGVLCAYVPTTIQAQTTVLAMGERGFGQVQTFEVLHRPWHVTDRSVRPDHRMVAHTGFITVGRLGERVPGGQGS